jgi:hypothetical protein
LRNYLAQIAAERGERYRAGAKSFEELDQPLIDEMHKLITNKHAHSITAAAGMVRDKAKGTGTPESKVKRLERRYKKKYPPRK